MIDGAGEDERPGEIVEQRRDADVRGELAARDGAGEQLVDPAPLVYDDLLAQERAQLFAVAQLADQPAGEVRVLVDVLDHRLREREQVAAQAALVGQRVRVRVLGADRVEDDLLLAARPAAIDRRLADAGATGQRLDRHPVIADLGHELDRGPQDRLAALRVTRTPAQARLGRHTHIYDTVS